MAARINVRTVVGRRRIARRFVGWPQGFAVGADRRMRGVVRMIRCLRSRCLGLGTMAIRRRSHHPVMDLRHDAIRLADADERTRAHRQLQ